MDTDSLYLAIAHKNLFECIQPANKQEPEALRQQDCDNSSKADAIQNFFSRTCTEYKRHNKREPGFFKKRIPMYGSHLSL